MDKLKGIPVYAVVIPFLIVVVLIYGGVAQRFLPALKTGDTTLTAAQFNYYYYSEYLEFTDANYDELDELGLDTQSDLAKQVNRDGITWEAYFKALGIRRAAETQILLELAEAEGYIFREEDMAAYNAELANIDAYTAQTGISPEAYIKSYYGSTMTEGIYRRELERDCRARAYGQVLRTRAAEAYLQETGDPAILDGDDYYLADLYAARFAAVPDRFTGEFGESQYADLSEKADRFIAKWIEAGRTPEAFWSLSELYADSGTEEYSETDKGLLPEDMTSWCFEESRAPGDVSRSISENGMWIVCYVGRGHPASQMHAAAQAGEAAYSAQIQAGEGSCSVKELFGMHFAM